MEIWIEWNTAQHFAEIEIGERRPWFVDELLANERDLIEEGERLLERCQFSASLLSVSLPVRGRRGRERVCERRG